MSENSVPCVHIEDGKYIISYNGHAIHNSLISSISLYAGKDTFHTINVEMLVNPMADDSHIKRVFGKGSSSRPLESYRTESHVEILYKGEMVGQFMRDYYDTEFSEKDRKSVLAGMLQLDGIEADLSYDLAERISELWKLEV